MLNRSLMVLKRPGREADHFPMSNSKVQNEWVSPATGICLLGVNEAQLVSSCHARHKFMFYDLTSRLSYIQCEHFIVSLNRYSVVGIFTRLHAE